MLFISKNVVCIFLENKYHYLTENIKKIYILGSELKDEYEFSDYLNDQNKNTKLNLENFKLGIKKEESFSDTFFQIETTKKTRHLNFLPFFIKELFFLSNLSHKEFTDNLKNIFLFKYEGIHIQNNKLFIEQDFFNILNKEKLFDIATSLQINYLYNNEKQVILYILEKLFGYKVKEDVLEKSYDLDQLVIGFLSFLIKSEHQNNEKHSPVVKFSFGKQFSVCFFELINILGKKIDIVEILKTLKLFGCDINVDLEKKVFFIRFFSFLEIHDIEDCIEEIIRICSFKLFTIEKLKPIYKQSSTRKELCDYLINSGIKEINTLPFSNKGGYLISNPVNKENKYIRDTLFFNLNNAKKSVFEISSIFFHHEKKIISYQMLGIYEKIPGLFSNKILFDLLFYISSNKKTFFNNIDLELNNNMFTAKNKNLLLFREVLQERFLFTEINLELFEEFKISFLDLRNSKILFYKFSYFKYIDRTFFVTNNLELFWKEIFNILKQGKRKLFLGTFIKEKSIHFTIRYLFENELEYTKFKDSLKKKNDK